MLLCAVGGPACLYACVLCCKRGGLFLILEGNFFLPSFCMYMVVVNATHSCSQCSPIEFQPGSAGGSWHHITGAALFDSFYLQKSLLSPNGSPASFFYHTC